MRIFTRYILKEAFLYFSICLLAFTGILLTVRMLRFASLIINKGVLFSQIGMVFLSIIPTFLEIAIPMAALLGVMLAFARLSGDSEIIVIRASGVSLTQLLRPVVVFGAILCLVTLCVSLELKPWGHRLLSRTLFEIARSKSTSGLEQGMFNKLGLITLYSERIQDRSGSLQKVLIDDKRDEENRKVIFAKTGRITSDSQRQTITLNLYNGEIHEHVNNHYTLTKFTTNSLVLGADELYNPDAKRKGKITYQMGLADLGEAVKTVQSLIAAAHETKDASVTLPEDLGGHTLPVNEARRHLRSYDIERGKRFSMPFAAFLMALIAMPLGIQPPRTQKTWGAGLSAAIALTVFVGYYALLSLGITMGESGTVHPFVGLWIPNLIAGITAIYALRQMGTERWQSIAHGFEYAALALSRRTKKWSGS